MSNRYGNTRDLKTKYDKNYWKSMLSNDVPSVLVHWHKYQVYLYLCLGHWFADVIAFNVTCVIMFPKIKLISNNYIMRFY